MKKILFVCDGNVGRSQMAEGFYKHYVGKDSATSAGFTDVGSKYNFIPREDIILVMKERGIDISIQRIKQITSQMIDEAKKIVILCNPKLIPLSLKKNISKVLFRQINDPCKCSINGVREIRDRIEQLVLELVNENK